MLKSCKAAQSAYLDNGGIASSVISLPVLSGGGKLDRWGGAKLDLSWAEW